MLIDIFGRTYPEREFFMVDRDAVMRYKARVHRNVAKVAERIEASAAQCGGGSIIPVISGRAEGADPESLPPGFVNMDFRVRSRAASRNDRRFIF